MADTFKAACVQTNSARDPKPAYEEAEKLIRDAAAQGAEFITTPEMVGMMEPKTKKLFEKSEPEEGNWSLTQYQALTKELGVWLLVGSLPVAVEGGDERVANRSYLLDPRGAVAAKYDKIHMFDVDLKDQADEAYMESRVYRPGAEVVTAKLPWGTLGMTVCYDVRFAYLYRALAQKGADFITVPAAFTRPTGKAHWQTLLRSRAIETGCFIIAPGQCGEHAEGRKTWGHSLIIDPWGEILAEADAEPGVITADIDPARVREVRKTIPSLQHDREIA